MADALEFLASQSDRILNEIAAINTRLARIEPRIDGIPLGNRKLNAIEQELRSLKAAFNDFARTNVTAGEIEALHADVNRAQQEYMELGTRLATVERLLDEMREERSTK